MSEALLDFVRPILDRAPPGASLEHFRPIFEIAVLVWNGVAAERWLGEPRGLQAAHDAVAALPRAQRPSRQSWIAELDRRRRSRPFVDDARLIDKWELLLDPNYTLRLRADYREVAAVARLRPPAARGNARAAPARPAAPVRSPKVPASPASPVSARSQSPPPRAAPPTAPAPRTLLPDPPATNALTVAITPLDATALASLLAGPRDELGDVAHALAAHALARAEQFSELLSLGVVQGVERQPYQIETVRRVLRVLRGRALLADEVGLGKTIEALLVLLEYRLRGMVRRVLVLAPPALVPQWAAELESKAQLAVRSTEDSQLRLDADAFWREDGIVVASMALARSAKNAPHVQASAWDLVIVDEAHHVKNRSTLSWKLVDGLRSRFLLLLTATPIENDLEELYNLVTLLKPGQFATPAVFRKQFVDPKDPTSPRNRERLRQLLAEVMIRNTRAQSGLRLPPRFVTTVAVDPSDGERALYEGILGLLREHSSDARARTATATLLLEAGSSPQAVRGTLEHIRAGEKHAPEFRGALASIDALAERVPSTRKADALMDLLRAAREPALVFTRYRNTLAYLSESLGGADLSHVTFHGGMSIEDKQSAVERFRDLAQPTTMLATDVGGEGHNLQHCHLLINFNLPWNPMLIEQRIGRLHRYGQTQAVQVYNLCARGTIEERVLEVLDGRVRLFELVVGEMDMVLGNLADERDLEERILGLYREATSEEEIRAGFDPIAEELLAARGRYDKTRSLDEALFGKDYEA